MLKDKVYLTLVTLILITAAILRFWKINEIPPGSEIIAPQRLLAAFLGTLTILLLNVLVLLWLKNNKLSLLISFVYAILPLAIMESRIASYITLAVFIYLIGLLLWFKKNQLIKLSSILLFTASAIVIIANLPYLYNKPFNISKNIVANVFDAGSFTTILFENDTYWEGGFRNWGMLYPEFIIPFLIGLYAAIKNKWFLPLLYFCAVIVLTALNPVYPEARELGLISPMLAFIIGVGLYSFTKNISPKILIWLYILILLYGVSNFLHYYFIHYNFRVVQEKSAAKNSF